MMVKAEPFGSRLAHSQPPSNDRRTTGKSAPTRRLSAPGRGAPTSLAVREHLNTLLGIQVP
eukprot:12165490-Alexandrium_andersonii.AAC.1